MKEIIFQNPDTDNLDKTADIAQVIACAVKQSSAPGSINQLFLQIDLDDLSEDPSCRARDLRVMLTDLYRKEKGKYEKSHNSVVRNGTYPRKFALLDPIDNNAVYIIIVMQRYKHKEENRTRTFYGGLFMPRCPYLLSQVITILSERELSIEYARQWQETEKQSTVLEYCLSWGITVRLYYSFFAQVMARYSAEAGACSRKEFREFLCSLSYS